MKEVGDEIKTVAKTIGAVRMERVAEAIRGPKRSHADPMARREKTELTKATASLALTSTTERLRLWWMSGRRGVVEKVEKKQENNNSHARR
ncbi:hypothetical protein V6N13_149112 [Hibiscus sabdariffa]